MPSKKPASKPSAKPSAKPKSGGKAPAISRSGAIGHAPPSSGPAGSRD